MFFRWFFAWRSLLPVVTIGVEGLRRLLGDDVLFQLMGIK